MPVVASPIITEGSSTSPDDLWPLSYLLAADWTNGVVTRTAFATGIVVSKNRAEQRRGFLGKPMRASEAVLRSNPGGTVRGLQSVLQRSTRGRNLVPIYSDQTILGTAAGFVQVCDTLYRRFFVGGRCCTYDPGTGNYFVATITGVTPTSITTDTTFPAGIASGAFIWPLLEAKCVIGDLTGRAITDNLNETRIAGMEAPGPWNLDALTAPGTLPAGFSTYAGYPILNIVPDLSDDAAFKIHQEGTYAASGTSQIPILSGNRASFGRSLPLVFFTRAATWSFLNFAESRCGRLFPFWVPSPTSDFEVLTYTGSGVTVKAVSAATDWMFWPYMAMVKTDGSVQVRHITGTSRASGVDTVTLDSAFVTTGAPIDRVCICHLMRFASDELAEQWSTDQTCQVNPEVEELINEKDYTINDIGDPIVEPIDPWLPIPICEDIGVTAPTYYYPCPAPSERPLGKAAPFLLPLDIFVTLFGPFQKDMAFPITSGALPSNDLLAALPDSYKCQFVSMLSNVGTEAYSRHWHHVQVTHPAGFVFTHNGTGGTPFIARALYRGTKDYEHGGITHTITMEILAEWDTMPGAVAYGAAGVLYHVCVYGDETNPGYVEGAAFAPRGGCTFTKADPCVWGSIAGGALTDKWCHPKMLLNAAVVTSWETPCDRFALTCNDPRRREGFDTCDASPTNGAPWVLNNPAICPDITVFGLGPWRAMSLGGECPESEVFPFLVCENRRGEGFTALIPMHSGWNETTGMLDVIGGSSMAISACSPPQNRISCCDAVDGFAASPTCWGPPDPNKEACCFPTDCEIRLVVTQKCIENFAAVGADCSPDMSSYNDRVVGTGETTFQLKPCAVVYSQGGSQALRSFTWEAWTRDKSAAGYNKEDDFDAADPLGWVGSVGTWDSFTAGTAKCPTPAAGGTLPFRTQANTGTAVQDFTMSIDVLRSGEHGMSIYNAGDNAGYAVIADSTAHIIKLVKFTSTTVTILATTPVASLAAPYRLNWSRKGPNTNASVDGIAGAYVEATDCTMQDVGVFSIVSNAGTVEFDNFEISNNDSWIRVVITFDQNGWNIDVPAEAMPLYPQGGPTGCVAAEGDPLYGSPGHCPANYTTRHLVPTDIHLIQDSAGLIMGLPGINRLIPADPPGPYPDFEMANAMVVYKTINCGTNYVNSMCVGFGAWYGLRVA